MTVTDFDPPTDPLATPDDHYRRPLISLRGENGDEIPITGVGQGWTLKKGATGLGLPPREVTTVPRIGGGSHLRSVRDKEREIFLPIDVHFGYGEDMYGRLEAARRRVEAVCAGEVEIRMRLRDRTVSAFAQYVEGLEGTFTAATVNGYRMNLGLKFLSPEQWWYGEEVTREWALTRIAKPLVTSKRIPFFPVFISPSTVAGGWEIEVRGDAPVQPIWEVTPPGRDLRIENKLTGEKIVLTGELTEPVTFDSALGDITSPTLDRGELWDRFTTDSELFELAPGMNGVAVTLTGSNLNSKVRLRYRERFRAGH